MGTDVKFGFAQKVIKSTDETNDIDFTDTNLGGATPVGALFWCSYAYQTTGDVGNALTQVGGYDGTNQFSCQANDENDVPTTAGSVAHSSSSCIQVLDVGANTVYCKATGKSFGADKVTVTVNESSSAGTNGILVNCMLIAGADAQVFVGSADKPAAGYNPSDSATYFDITHNFGLDNYLFLSFSAGLLGDGIDNVSTNKTHLCYGVGKITDASGTTGVSEWVGAWGSDVGDSAGDLTAGVSDGDRCIVAAQTNATTWNNQSVQIWGPPSSENAIRGVRAGGTNIIDCSFMVIGVGDTLSIDLWSGDSPTATPWAVTGVGYEPQAVMIFANMLDAVDTDFVDDDDCGSWAICYATAEGDESSIGFDLDNGASNSACFSYARDTFVYLESVQSATFSLGSPVFDSDGWDVSSGTVDGTARKWFGFTVEKPSAGIPSGLSLLGVGV